MIKEQAPFDNSIKKTSNLKDYQKYPMRTKKPSGLTQSAQRSSKIPRISKMQKDVQSYMRKTQEREVRCIDKDDSIKQDEPLDSDDTPFSSEKPLKNAPVPHQMHPLHQKRFSSDFVNDEVSRATKNESNIDSRAFTDDSFNIKKPQRNSQNKNTRPVKELSVSMPHNYGEEDEITVNKTINDEEDDENLEEPVNKT